ncbi:unnamed protein product [Peniophora sp. CBMAI 1063]|nr:unnamed protein product [Peniophora sp. CBMAI 1063]
MLSCLRRPLLAQNALRFTRTPALRNAARHEHTAVTVRGTPAPYAAKRTSYFNPTLILIGTVPIFAFALGVWQVKRLKWKINLIDELTEKLHREPIVLPGQVNLETIQEFLYRKVIVRGQWDHEHAMLLGPRVLDGKMGFHLFTPLIRGDGSTVLVDRGWISEDFSTKGMRNEPTGVVEVRGLLRATQARNSFTPDNHPEKGEWFWADLDAMVDYAGGEKAGVQPVLIEEMFEGHGGDATQRKQTGIPLGKVPVVDLRNSHLSYAITWFSLSAFTSYMFVSILRKRGIRAYRPMKR